MRGLRGLVWWYAFGVDDDDDDEQQQTANYDTVGGGSSDDASGGAWYLVLVSTCQTCHGSIPTSNTWVLSPLNQGNDGPLAISNSGGGGGPPRRPRSRSPPRLYGRNRARSPMGRGRSPDGGGSRRFAQRSPPRERRKRSPPGGVGRLSFSLRNGWNVVLNLNIMQKKRKSSQIFFQWWSQQASGAEVTPIFDLRIWRFDACKLHKLTRSKTTWYHDSLYKHLLSHKLNLIRVWFNFHLTLPLAVCVILFMIFLSNLNHVSVVFPEVALPPLQCNFRRWSA